MTIFEIAERSGGFIRINLLVNRVVYLMKKAPWKGRLIDAFRLTTMYLEAVGLVVAASCYIMSY
jgi:hypothetical protein